MADYSLGIKTGGPVAAPLRQEQSQPLLAPPSCGAAAMAASAPLGGAEHATATNDHCIVVHAGDGGLSVIRVPDNIVLHHEARNHEKVARAKALIASHAEKLATKDPSKVTSLGHALFRVTTYVDFEFTLKDMHAAACGGANPATIATAPLFDDMMRPTIGTLAPDAGSPNTPVDTTYATIVDVNVCDYDSNFPLPVGVDIPGVQKTQYKAGRKHSVILSQTSSQQDGAPLDVGPRDDGSANHAMWGALDPAVLAKLSLAFPLGATDTYLVHPFLALYCLELGKDPTKKREVDELWARGAEWKSREELKLVASQSFIVAAAKNLKAARGKMQLINMKTATVSFMPATKKAWACAVKDVADRFGCVDGNFATLSAQPYYFSVGIEITYMIPTLDSDLCAAIAAAKPC